MYLTLIIALVTVCLVLSAKLFFPHVTNRLLAGETYRESTAPSNRVANANAVLEVLPSGIFVLDEKYEIIYSNLSLAEELGTSRDRLLNVPVEDVFAVSEGLTKSLDQISKDAENPGYNNQAQVTYIHQDGNKTKLELVFSHFLEDSRSRFVCMVPSLTDLSASREQLRKTERLKAMGEMVSGLAHEINNPLTGVVGFANLLLESTGEDEPHREELQIIQENAQRCKDIIENMLGFMRSGQPESSELDVNEILENAIKLTRRDLDIENIEIQRNLDPELPSIHGNRTQLEEVFVNLLNNAKDELKNHQGEDPEIRVRTQPRGDDSIKISIEDSGSGIDPDQREEIFEPFFTTKSGGGGTGLGLPIVEGIINDLGGTISVDTSELGGAQFKIILPTVDRSKELEGQTTRELHSKRLPESVENIMAVEDEKSIRQLIDRFRGETGLDGETFENPIEAIDFLDHEAPDYNPDVIFLDLVYPGSLRGQDFVEWVEVHREDLLDRIIIMTGNPDDDQVRLTEKHEDIVLLTKPLSPPDLVQTINRQRSQRAQ